MSKVFKSIALACVALVLAGCETRTDKTDGGGVLLTISEFDLPPLNVSVSNALGPCEAEDDLACAGFVQIGEVVIANIQKDPTQASSDLMNVELTSYEVKYLRADAGTGVPGDYVQGLFSSVSVNGELTLNNFAYMATSQLTNYPLKDLMEVGQDPETGNDIIPLTFELRFFGRTLSGDAVETSPRFWTVEFLP